MSELMCSQAKCRRKDEHIAELKAELAALKEELVGYKYPLRTKETVSVQVEVWDAREAKLTTLREAAQEFFNKEMRGAAEAYAAKDRLRRMVLQESSTTGERE